MTYIGEVFSILTEQLGKNSLPLKSFLIFKDVPIHEAIHHGGVGMDVDIELQVNLLLRENNNNKTFSTR